MELSIDDAGHFEIALAPEYLRILAEAVNRVLETADWEFHTLMGVWPDEAQLVAEKLGEIVNQISSEVALTDQSPMSQDRHRFGLPPDAILLEQVTGATVRLVFTDKSMYVVRNALNTVVGAYGQVNVLASRAGVSPAAVRAFTDEFFDCLLAVDQPD